MGSQLHRLGILGKGPTGEHHDARGAVADLVVLRPAQLHKQLADLMLHLHLL